LSGFRIWDLSLERDAEEEAEFRAKMKEQANAPEDLPPQLLFVHQVLLLNCSLILS
jgi:ribosome assembly protein RRB1